MESFHYELLASDPQNPMIRLLTLQPGPDRSNIECTLSPVSLHDLPAYEALSYSWGDSECKSTIKCNKASKAITENLFAALCQIRSPTRSKLLWIDAICINQSSDRERPPGSTHAKNLRGSAASLDLAWPRLHGQLAGDGSRSTPLACQTSAGSCK